MKRIPIFGTRATKEGRHGAHPKQRLATRCGNRQEKRATGPGTREIAIGAFALLSLTAAPSAIAASFDGDWSLTAYTTDGHCGVTSWNIAIRGGRVYYPERRSLEGYPVDIAGLVSPSGVIRVNVVAGPRYATGAGRLSRVQGRGRWAGRGPSGTCAGVWAAARTNVYRPGVAGRYPQRSY